MIIIYFAVVFCAFQAVFSGLLSTDITWELSSLLAVIRICFGVINL